MSFVTTRPELLTAAAGSLSTVGAAQSAQNAAIAPPTTGVVPPAADAVSGLVATQFAAHGVAYQAVATMATQIHEAFVRTLATGGATYAATEAANVATGA